MSCPVSPVFGFILAVNSIIEQKCHTMLFKRAFTQKCWVVWAHGETFLCCQLQWGNYPRGKKQIYCKRQPFVSDGDYRFINFTVMGEQFHHFYPPHLTGLSPAQARLFIFFFFLNQDDFTFLHVTVLNYFKLSTKGKNVRTLIVRKLICLGLVMFLHTISRRACCLKPWFWVILANILKSWTMRLHCEEK